MEDGRSGSQVIAELVARAAGGDRAAQTELLRRYWKLIAGVVHVRRSRLGRQGRDRLDTMDLQQDVAIHILRELPKHVWQGRRAFIAWLKALTNAKVVDAQRHHMAAKRDAAKEVGQEGGVAEPRWVGPGVETQVDHRIQVQVIEALFDKVKPEYATAVRMHLLGFSHAEIAEALDLPSEEAARKVVARGLSTLQKLHGG